MILPRLLLVLSVCLLSPVRAMGQAPQPAALDTALLQRLLVAEDARGTGPNGIEPLLGALRNPDTLLRRIAVRGLGRLQRPELGRMLLPLLADAVPAVRAEAASAIAQSLRRAARGESSADSSRLGTRGAAEALARALAAERDSSVVDALGQSLGRLPLADSAAARAAEAAIRERFSSRQSVGLAHGLYTLARARRATGNLTDTSVALLRLAAVGSPDSMGDDWRSVPSPRPEDSTAARPFGPHATPMTRRGG